MENTHAAIKAIYGHEPMREGEYPAAYQIGSDIGGVGKISSITQRTDNYGDHGLAWFDVHVGDKIAVSISARAVAEIHYNT